MNKLVVLVRTPPDPAGFEDSWANEFVPRADRLPGLRRVAVSRVTGGPEGRAHLYLVH